MRVSWGTQRADEPGSSVEWQCVGEYCWWPGAIWSPLLPLAMPTHLPYSDTHHTWLRQIRIVLSQNTQLGWLFLLHIWSSLIMVAKSAFAYNIKHQQITNATQVCGQIHIWTYFGNTLSALVFQTHSVFIIVPVIQYLLLLKFYRVERFRELRPWLLALTGLIERQTMQQQLLPLSHLLLWNLTGHNSRGKWREAKLVEHRSHVDHIFDSDLINCQGLFN